MAKTTRELTAEELFLLLEQYRSDDVLTENGIEIGIDFSAMTKVNELPSFSRGKLEKFRDNGPTEVEIKITYSNGETIFRGYDVYEEQFVFSSSLDKHFIGYTNNFAFGTVKKEKLVVWHNITKVSETRKI